MRSGGLRVAGGWLPVGRNAAEAGAGMSRWMEPGLPRDQVVLFARRLDDAIAEDDPVRLLDEVLRELDWSEWEAAYDAKNGRRAVHPRVLASVLLYGLLQRVRSSRGLERALAMRLDFRWLAEDRKLDHTTISEFRRTRKEPLKRLFVQVCQTARELGFLQLVRVAYDGTRVRANNRRSGTRTPEELRCELEQLQRTFDEFHAAAESEDASDEQLFPDPRAQELPPELRRADQRRERIARTLERMQRESEQSGATIPRRLPTTDLDARVMNNKDGGFAPNYTPTTLVDVHSGLIAAVDVLAESNEDRELIPMLEQAQRDYGLDKPPGEVLADGMMGTGANLHACEEREITLYSPVEAGTDAVVVRADPSQPVPESERNKLPTRAAGKTRLLDKSAFVYDAANNCYWCPEGKPLSYAGSTSEKCGTGRRERRRYQADATVCAACPLKALCVSAQTTARTISREQYEGQRERQAERMSRPESQQTYEERRHAAETPFAVIKEQLGFRRFLLRGLKNVQTEWIWAALAYNLARLGSLLKQQAKELQTTASQLLTPATGPPVAAVPT